MAFICMQVGEWSHENAIIQSDRAKRKWRVEILHDVC